MRATKMRERRAAHHQRPGLAALHFRNGLNKAPISSEARYEKWRIQLLV